MIKSLYKTFRHWSQNGSVWIISDTHFADDDCKHMDADWISPEDQINNINGINESLVVERDGHLVALVHFDDNVLDWNYENEDRFIEDLERRKQDILDFVNTHVNRSSRIKEVEVEKQPFAKTATMKIKRFLYKDKKSETDNK